MPVKPLSVAAGVLALSALVSAQESAPYKKLEYMIPMRDGVRLYASVYIPLDKPGPHPILMQRTPYSAGPYGPDRAKNISKSALTENGFIFVFSDVRGRYASEGEFVNTRPTLQHPTGPQDIDESTDTYDTIEYLVKNVPQNNGKVGIRGISYPGGYAALAAINSHPALKCVSPQAPTANWFIGDDFHHHGAFFLQDAVEFLNGFGVKNNGAPNFYTPAANLQRGQDAYAWYLALGPVRNVEQKYFQGKVQFWNDMMRHGNYDEFWQSRSIPHNMKGVKCAVLTVGGWFDAEDLWGPLHTYAHTERQNRGIRNHLVMGPWSHGMWAGRGTQLGDIPWGFDTSQWFRDNVENPFYLHHLMGKGKDAIAEATIFETGANKWHRFSEWPPKARRAEVLSLGGTSLSFGPSREAEGAAAYVNDPSAPTPYQSQPRARRTVTYMIDDQRYFNSRPDVVKWTSPPLEKDVVLAGPIAADLKVMMSGTDADFVVKVIDVYPDDPAAEALRDYHMLVRAEVMRGKFRNSMVSPRPFTPGRWEQVTVPLNDVFHRFKKGHRIMVQVQSNWFPLVDRNPNVFTDIYSCGPEAFQVNNIKIATGKDGSLLRVGVMP
jgi:putative CocE/NonD family hydrolase